jgi:hypothetical protein
MIGQRPREAAHAGQQGGDVVGKHGLYEVNDPGGDVLPGAVRYWGISQSYMIHS